MFDSMPLLIGVLKATALLILALGITLALRRSPAGARYVVWLATFVALLLVPAVHTWSPFAIAVLPASPEAPAIPTARFAVGPPTQTDGAAGNFAQPSSADPRSATRPAPDLTADARLSPTAMILLVWGSVALVILGWLALGALKVRRITRHGLPLSDESWLTPLYETADRLELDNVPGLVMSSAIEMPFACGIRKPMIALPASAAQWSDERRRVVLFHELAHIRRRDLLGHTIGRVVCAAYWFHPMVWTAAKKLRAESERACDDLVIACGARASDYATHLLDIVTGVRRQGAPATALPMANKREFEGRMLAILDPSLRRATPSMSQQLVLGMGLGSLALSIAAVAPVRRMTDAAQQPPIVAAPAIVTAQAQQSRPSRLDQGWDPDPTASASPSPSPSPSPAIWTAPAASFPPSQPRAASVSPPASQARFVVEGQQADTSLLGRVLRTDRDPEVRRAAAWALQGRREGVPLLVERLREDTDASVREMSAWALAGYGSSEVVAALSHALRDRDDEVRATAAWALGNSHGSADVPQLVAALDDSSAQVRQVALWAIGQHRLTEAPPRVVAALKDRDDEVRLLAAWVLGQLLDRATIPAIRDAFLAEEDSDVAQAEFRALLFMGDRSQAVIDRAMSSDDAGMRARGVRMIAGQGAGHWPWPWPWPQPRPSP